MTSMSYVEPDPERARRLDRRMRERLGSSLRYIAGQANGLMPIDRTALEHFLSRLAKGAVPALTFGAYCDLVLAIEADRLDLAAALVTEIADAPNRSAGIVVSDLGDPITDPRADRYIRLVDTDPTISFIVKPPPSAASATCRERIAGALDLLEAGDPMMAAEIKELLGEIVLAVGSDDPTAMTFDGASSFLMWGAIVLNANGHKSVLETAQALVHESGHNVLFGLCADGSLAGDDDEARYRSPLRPDPRPMDGIIHATYVTARMHQSVGRLLKADVLDAAAALEAQASLIEHRRAFSEGIAVIDRHSRLTERGRAIMDSARAHMTQTEV